MSVNKKIQVVMSSMPPFEEYCNEVKSIWENRWLTHTGPKHQELEAGLCEYLGVDYIDLFANGHMALELAIKALDLKGEVITTPFTFASTTQAIVRNGLTPVFCDINRENFTIDVDKIEELITDKTSAIMPVHVYGNICDVESIDKIAKKHNLKVIYDAAHVCGVEYNGVGMGNFGDMSMFSFHATKVFHTVEGGGITFKDEKYKQRFAQLRQFGMNGQESVPIVGTNAKMTEMHAAMGICNLRYIDEEIAKRGRAEERYRERLGDVDGIYIPKLEDKVKSNHAYFPAVFDGHKFDRDVVSDALASNNIFARKYFYPLTSSFEAYKGLFDIQETPIATDVAKKVLCLPLFADLTVGEVDTICDIILSK